MGTKKTLHETYKFTIPVRFLPYLFNADMEGLTEAEINKIEEYLSGFGCFSTKGETFFSYWNDIDKLGSDCIILTALKI